MTVKIDPYEELYFRYPILCSRNPGNKPSTSFDWGGFCVGAGWYKIIEGLCEDLSVYPVRLAQVKEKFGQLRVYIDPLDCTYLIPDEVYKTVREAELLSGMICEDCGEPGDCNGRGWLRTLCRDCDAKLGK